jgi:hypothetical protein
MFRETPNRGILDGAVHPFNLAVVQGWLNFGFEPLVVFGGGADLLFRTYVDVELAGLVPRRRDDA